MKIMFVSCVHCAYILCVWVCVHVCVCCERGASTCVCSRVCLYSYHPIWGFCWPVALFRDFFAASQEILYFSLILLGECQNVSAKNIFKFSQEVLYTYSILTVSYFVELFCSLYLVLCNVLYTFRQVLADFRVFD